jgi:heme/copper-type cytochrome/quinol oxidase subunit 3
MAREKHRLATVPGGSVVEVSTSTATADPRAAAGEADPGEGAPGRVGMWMFLVTDAMGFAGLLLAYAVLRVRAPSWPDPYQRLALGPTAAMTLALITSSLTMSLAVGAARAGRGRARAAWLGVTVLLGLAFLGGQAAEYARLATGPQALRLTTDTFSSTFYALTGFHGAHVLAGVIYLGTLLGGRAARPATLEVASLFWTFVDLAWVPIFSFLYLLPTS